MSTIGDLWDVQTTDLAIESIRHRLTDLDKARVETPELQAARQLAAEGDSQLAAYREQQRALDVQNRDLEQRIRSAERDLMSGRVKNPKELEGMQANVEALRRRRRALEDDDLEAMLQVEHWQAQAIQRHAELERVESAWQTGQTALTEEFNRLTGELKSMSATLNRQWNGISAQDRELYRTLRTRKAGRALALVGDGSCQSCGMFLPTGTVQAVYEGEQHIFCPTCGRLLYAKT